MAQHSMVVTGHSNYSGSVYTLSNSGGTGLQSVTVLCNGTGVAFWGSFFGTSATIGVTPTTYAALWADVSNTSVTTTIVLQVSGSTVDSMNWSTA